MIDRPDKNHYFMNIAKVVATRSTCLHHQVGAVLERDGQVLSTGYNGAPSGLAHCLELGCLRENIPSGTQHEVCRAVHAEGNCIIQSAIHGVDISGATLYCTHQPCILCAKMLINARISKVVFEEPYPDASAIQTFIASGIFVERLKDV